MAVELPPQQYDRILIFLCQFLNLTHNNHPFYAPRRLAFLLCLVSVPIICHVVVSQRSPATPPSILLASDGPADDA